VLAVMSRNSTQSAYETAPARSRVSQLAHARRHGCSPRGNFNASYGNLECAPKRDLYLGSCSGCIRSGVTSSGTPTRPRVGLMVTHHKSPVPAFGVADACAHSHPQSGSVYARTIPIKVTVATSNA